MQILEQIGMNKGWIYEVIISTYSENGPHSAPIGVWTDDYATLRMEIFKSTRTVTNILNTREFVVNLISDLAIFYESLFDKAKIEYHKSTEVNAPVIKEAPSAMEFRLSHIDEKEQTFRLESIPVHVQGQDAISLINRAAALTLESLVLATKRPHLPKLRTDEILRENYRVVKKVAPGSRHERIMGMLFDHMQISCE